MKTHFSRYWPDRKISFRARVTLASVLREDGRLLAPSNKTDLNEKGVGLIEFHSHCVYGTGTDTDMLVKFVMNERPLL